MSVILHVSNAQKFHKLTGLCAGILVATYITFEAPISGMSMNPARTLASAVQAHHWTALWIYFAATLSNGKVFVDMTRAPGEDAIDGIKVDQKGNLYVCGPGGIWVLSSEGKHLGTIKAPKNPHNIAWGGPDGKTLYIAAQNTLYRMPLNIPGIRPGDIQALAAQR
jgi:sugar lactone lactonase YvrE